NMDPNEANVYTKLQQLNNELNKSASKNKSKFTDASSLQSSNQNYNASKDINHLEAMMNAMKEGKESDPEMEKLNNMLDKIFAIQHPEAIGDSTNKMQPGKQKTYKVNVDNNRNNI